jgi:hypothetical protein
MRIVWPAALGLIATCLLPGPLWAGNAPPPLRNKTLSVSWTTERTIRAPNGRERHSAFTVNRTIYVSSAGRFFVKVSVAARAGEAGPGDKQPHGGARDVTFTGGKIVGFAERGKGAGAGRMIISFDPSYSSCTVNVSFGTQPGKHLSFRTRNGMQAEVLDFHFSGQHCSIRSGNVFAS